MNLLITNGASALAQGLADALRADHTVRLSGRRLVKSDHEFVVSSLNHDAATSLLVRGMDAIIHSIETDADASTAIDAVTRGTYNLLMAAATEGVSRVILLSSLALMTPYKESYIVDERWRPLPATEPPTLTAYLGEFVCREFAREHKIAVTVLRLGEGLGVAETASAILCALQTQGLQWSVYHLAAPSDQERFPITKAKDELGIQLESETTR